MSSSGASAGGSLRVILGPTAAGKSPLAMALAERVPLAIISADSRQVYRGFDIGTAKPSRAERARVPHFGIDVIEPTERYSAAAWAAGAGAWLRAAEQERRTPVIVGGTGFYVRALVRPLFAEPPLDPVRRAELADELAPMPTAELRRRVAALDPPRAHLGRAQLLRALEVRALTGRALSEWYAAPAAAGQRARYLVVDPGPALARRIAERVERMLEAGWPAEVEALLRSVPSDAPAWNATGYSTVRGLVRGRISRARAVEVVTIATRQYAKRQRTWFRHQLEPAAITRLDPTASDALDRALAWWHDDSGGDAA